VIEHVAPDDPRVAAYRRVGDAGWLRGQRLFVAEGRLLLERLVASAAYRIASVLVTPAAAAALAPTLSRVDADVLVLDLAVMKDLTGFNFHRGCLALAERPAARTVADLPRIGCVLGLEGVGNPDNVGGLFRTAAAFGVAAVLLDPSAGDPFYRKALRTSMGAVLTLPVVRVDDWTGALGRLKEDGWTIVALTPARDAEPLESAAAALASRERRLLLVGSEGAGLASETLASADARVRIPISGAVDSLNVTVAAGIALARLGG
jgi:tRNA G18 (ribose-2'-O)-methylase SpoU